MTETTSVDLDAAADGSAHQKLLVATARYCRALEADPTADGTSEAQLAGDLMELAAREVVREVERRDPGQRPAGWEDGLITGAPEPGSPRFRGYTCGRCGAEWTTNCDQRDVQCVECDARLCASCGRWEEVQV